MTTRIIVHVSDLHIGGGRPNKESRVFDSLELAARSIASKDGTPALLAITGDVFQSADMDATQALTTFLERFARLRVSLGGDVPTVILPGNHDRRGSGVVLPWSTKLYGGLADALAKHAHVHVAGCAPAAAEYLAATSSALGLDVVAIDSTRVPFGYLSAGGLLRPEDVLSIVPRLRHAGPVVFMLHHHLVPTPVTDEGRIDASREPWFKKLMIEQVARRIVAFGDREELTMTAFGAGTTLSLLHSLGRPVLVLHGHKHYPTARVLAATREGEGDVVLASAGSAGMKEAWRATQTDLRLWPSINVARWTEPRLDVGTVFFAPEPDASSRGEQRTRTYDLALLAATADERRWSVAPVAPPPAEPAQVELDRAVFVLTPSRTRDGYLDLACERTVTLHPPATLSGWRELLEGAPGAVAEGEHVERDGNRSWLCLAHGTPARYVIRNAVCGTFEAVRRAYEDDQQTPFEWVGLTVRRPSVTARLEVRGIPASAVPFGSVTDLHTGRQWPVPVTPDGEVAVLEVKSCPARHLLRVHWQVVGS